MNEVIEWLRSPEGIAWSLKRKGDGGTEWSPMIDLKEDVPLHDNVYIWQSVGFRMRYADGTGLYPF